MLKIDQASLDYFILLIENESWKIWKILTLTTHFNAFTRGIKQNDNSCQTEIYIKIDQSKDKILVNTAQKQFIQSEIIESDNPSKAAWKVILEAKW